MNDGTGTDAVAPVRRLTGGPEAHSNVYMDVAYADATSRYVMCLKHPETRDRAEVWRYDLQTGEAILACERVFAWEGVTVSPDQRWFCCARRPRPDLLEVVQVEIATLAVVTVTFACPERLIGCCATCTPDRSAIIMPAFLGPHRFGLLRFDLNAGTWTVCHEGGDELCNSNPLLEPGEGRWLLVQQNRGAECDAAGRCLRSTGPEGATMFLLETNTGAVRSLPLGWPHTGACGGHSSWAGGTGQFVTNISWSSEAETQARGCLAVVAAAAGSVRVLGQGLCAVHVNASRDGRFFVADSWADNWRDPRLTLGSLRTGRWEVLCAHGSSFGGSQCTHPHAWLTPDNRWVVFNSDRGGTPQVHVVAVPEALLEALEADP